MLIWLCKVMIALCQLAVKAMTPVNDSHEWAPANGHITGYDSEGKANLVCRKCGLRVTFPMACAEWRPELPPASLMGAYERDQKLDHLVIDALQETDRQLSLAIFGAEEVKQLDLFLELTQLRVQLNRIREKPRTHKGVGT